MAIFICLLYVLILSFLSIILLKLFKHSNSKLPPSPPKLPIIGNLHQLGELPHQTLWRLSKKYGPVMQLKLCTVPTVVVSSYEAARQALKVYDLNCYSRPLLAGTGRLSYNLDVSFVPFNDYWKEVRKVIDQEFLSVNKVISIRPIVDEEVRKLIYSFGGSASQKTEVNLNKKLLALTVSVVCKAAFSVNFEGTVLNNERFTTLICNAVEALGSFFASDFIPYIGWIIDCF